MNPLETNRQVLTWLSGIPPHESDSKRKRIAYIAFTVGSVSIGVTAAIASATSIYQDVSVNLEDSLYSLITFIGGLQVLYQSIAIVFLRHKLLKIFEKLLTIYNESEKELKISSKHIPIK